MAQSSPQRPLSTTPFAQAIGAPPAPPPPPPPQATTRAAVLEQPEGIHGIPVQLPSTMEGIVRIAYEKNFSDIHLGVGEEPRYRNRGEIVRTGWPVTDKTTFREWLRQILEPSDVDTFQREKEYDGSFSFPFVRVRINVLETLRGSAMVLRLILRPMEAQSRPSARRA